MQERFRQLVQIVKFVDNDNIGIREILYNMTSKIPDITEIQTSEQSSFFGSTLISLGGWSWIILGMVLIAAEIFMPGAFLIWFGLSAALTGIITLILPIGWHVQLIIFTLLAVLCLVFIRRILKQRDYDVDQPHLNAREAQLKGRKVVVVEEIVNGVGKVSLGDTQWQARGPDTPKGETVIITGMSGASLNVDHFE